MNMTRKKGDGSSCSRSQDVDCGYAWVVAFVAFASHFIMGGFAYTTGVFYVEFLEVFKESRGTTAWISSLLYGMLCATGPVASILICVWGCRWVLLCGTLISSAGMIATIFAHKIYVVFFTLGITTGFGFGLIFTTAVISISFHFQRYRSLMLGVSLAGGGIGTMAYPWISRALIQAYAWRGALVMTSGINLHLAVLAFLLPNKSPLDPKYSHPKKVGKSQEHWKEKFRLHLFKSLVFNLLCVNCVFFNFALLLIYTHISAYTLSLGLGQTVADSLVSMLGIASLVGRVSLGAVGQLQRVNVPMLFVVCYAMAGLATIALGLLHSVLGLTISIFICGVFAAAYGPLLGEVTFLIAGPRDFNHAYGYLLIYQGLGTVLGPPIAGVVYDLSHVYQASFYLGGCAFLVSSIVMIPHFCFLQNYKYKEEEGPESQCINIKIKDTDDCI